MQDHLVHRPDTSTSSDGTPDMPLPGREPGRFMAFTRYPDPDFIASGVFPYEGARIKESAVRYTYRPASGAEVPSLPLNRLPYPDLAPLIPILGTNEASMLRYFYFHYPDHVDVAPALRSLSAMREQDLDDKGLAGLVLVTGQNYAPGAIARLEINGQTMDIGESVLQPVASRPAPCPSFAQPVGTV